MDDVLVFGNTKEEHDARLMKVLKQISKAGVTLNQDKCLFSQERITFLGHVIDQTGRAPDPDKVSAILSIYYYSRSTLFHGNGEPTGKFSPQLATIFQPIEHC